MVKIGEKVIDGKELGEITISVKKKSTSSAKKKIVAKKKTVRKKVTKKKIVAKKKDTTLKTKITSLERETLLIDNFIGLQKAMVNLSIKFENLSDNISRLLNVFEISAKEYVSGKGKGASDIERDMLNRINLLLDQNKAILGSVKGMEEKSKKDINPPLFQSISSPSINPQKYRSPSNPPETFSSQIPGGMQPSSFNPSEPSKQKTIVETI